MSVRFFSKILFLPFILLSFAGGKQTVIDISDQLPPCPADFLTDSLLAGDGSIWVTSEGKGVYRLDPSKEKQSGEDSWFDASYYEGLPDTANYYAIAEDKQGRIWVGTDNKGVAVFNGEKWKTYDRENALLGERVFDIAVSPATGDVAIATSGGVNVYQPHTQNWLNLTRAEGLVEDQVETLAYDNQGNLWLGYQCGGVSQLSEKNKYQIVKTDQSKWYWDENNRVRQPMDGTGSGLPSNLSNVVYPTKSGAVLLGTNSGLAMKTAGNDWKYIRGKDYRDKNKGLWDVKIDKTVESKTGPALLPEDYITCLAETDEGWWIGFRQQGAVLVNPQNLRTIKTGKIPDKIKRPYITSLLALPGGSVYAGTYGHGFMKVNDGKGKKQLAIAERKEHPAHPSVPPVKTLEELKEEMDQKAKLVSAEISGKESPTALFWKEDWATQGDWCQSYGKDYALLCGTCNMGNDIIINSFAEINISQMIGPHKREDDSLYVRPHNDNSSVNPNVLWNPKTGTRIATEWSDNGEEYPRGFDGPDIWLDIQVPEGEYIVTLYFHNYEGQNASIGRQRDYLLELRPGSMKSMVKNLTSSSISRTRVKNFHGSGVYKTFIAQGPGSYSIRILNDYSSDAILNGVFVSNMKSLQKETADLLKSMDSPISDGITPYVMRELMPGRNNSLSAYRSLKSAGKAEPLRPLLNLWNQHDHKEFEKSMLKKWYDEQDDNDYYVSRSQEYYPFSPRTIAFTARECEAMVYMGIDWKIYLPDSKIQPEIGPMELKEKIASINEDQLKKLKDQYHQKVLQEINDSYIKQKKHEN